MDIHRQCLLFRHAYIRRQCLLGELAADLEQQSLRGKMYIAIWNCICYNASRQKSYNVPCGQRNEPPNRSCVQSGGSSFLLYWQSTQ